MVKQTLKKILPTNLIWYLTRKIDDINYLKIKIIKSNRLLLSLDMLFCKEYLNEHKAHLEGAYNYKNSIRSNSINTYFLRRNIHRIEKGMLMKPKRSVFALRFIYETTQAFDTLIKKQQIEASEFEWSYQVLKKYFSMVESSHEEYQKSKKIFNNLVIDSKYNQKLDKIPFNYKPNNSIEFDKLKDFIFKRKSVRWFLEKEITNDIIDKALELALASPSSCNRSPYRYFISNTNKELTNKIASIPAGTIGWHQNIPAIAVIIGQQRAFPNKINRHSIYVDSCLSIMPFVLGLESLGLSTCIINWADDPSREKQMRKILSLENDEKVILSIAIGYADKEGKVAYSQRKTNKEIVKYL